MKKKKVMVNFGRGRGFKLKLTNFPTGLYKIQYKRVIEIKVKLP